MNREISRLLAFFAAAFVLAAIGLTLRQSFSPALAKHPGNRRALLDEFSIERGSILAADGRVLAESVKAPEGWRRRYPAGAVMAPVTGYYDPIHGRTGLELSQTEWLTAKDKYRSISDWLRAVANRPRRGYDVTLTLRPDVQEAAARALGSRAGAVVALEPRTGRVLALVSSPSYDPNLIGRGWRAMSAQAGAPLLNRSTEGLYPPGSTFKIVTAAAALAGGRSRLTTKYEGPPVLAVGGGRVTNFADQSHGTMTLADAFRVSSNTIFAQIGLRVGADLLTRQASDFGWGGMLPFELPTRASQIPAPETMDKVMVAWTAVGQGRTLITPLHMALVGAAVAGDGHMPVPYLVETVADYQGAVVKRAKPSEWLTVTDRGTAQRLRELMVDVVARGTGRGTALSDVTVAGKTGTAEAAGGRTHAWFVGFAPAEAPRVAVAVLVEDGGLGGRTAAPIARTVLEKALVNND